jgi:CheY-like chemotaxis protein
VFPRLVMHDSGTPAPSGSLEYLEPRAPRKAAQQLILVADDDPVIADTLEEILSAEGYGVLKAYDGRVAVELAARQCPHTLLTDVVMPEINGIEAAKQILAMCPGTRIMLMSGQAETRSLLAEAREQGYDFDVLAKPVHPTLLLSKLRQT